MHHKFIACQGCAFDLMCCVLIKLNFSSYEINVSFFFVFTRRINSSSSGSIARTALLAKLRSGRKIRAIFLAIFISKSDLTGNPDGFRRIDIRLPILLDFVWDIKIYEEVIPAESTIVESHKAESRSTNDAFLCLSTISTIGSRASSLLSCWLNNDYSVIKLQQKNMTSCRLYIFTAVIFPGVRSQIFQLNSRSRIRNISKSTAQKINILMFVRQKS